MRLRDDDMTTRLLLVKRDKERVQGLIELPGRIMGDIDQSMRRVARSDLDRDQRQAGDGGGNGAKIEQVPPTRHDALSSFIALIGGALSAPRAWRSRKRPLLDNSPHLGLF